MEIAADKVFKVETLSIADYTKKYGLGITSQAVDYAMNQDKIDFVMMGKHRFVVMTAKTRAYVPNKSNLREKPVKNKRKARVSA